MVTLWLHCLLGSHPCTAENWSSEHVRNVRKCKQVYYRESSLSEGDWEPESRNWPPCKVGFPFISPCCGKEWILDFSCPGPLHVLEGSVVNWSQVYASSAWGVFHHLIGLRKETSSIQGMGQVSCKESSLGSLLTLRLCVFLLFNCRHPVFSDT